MKRADKEDAIIQAIKQSAQANHTKHNFFALAIMLDAPSDKQIDDMLGYVKFVEQHANMDIMAKSIAPSIIHDLNQFFYNKKRSARTGGYARYL